MARQWPVWTRQQCIKLFLQPLACHKPLCRLYITESSTRLSTFTWSGTSGLTSGALPQRQEDTWPPIPVPSTVVRRIPMSTWQGSLWRRLETPQVVQFKNCEQYAGYRVIVFSPIPSRSLPSGLSREVGLDGPRPGSQVRWSCSGVGEAEGPGDGKLDTCAGRSCQQEDRADLPRLEGEVHCLTAQGLLWRLIFVYYELWG